MQNNLFRSLKFAHIASIALVASTFALLSPTTGSLSGVANVFGYGAGLSVDSTTVVNGFAIADNTYDNGFKFRMRVTVDSPSESNLKLKFNDWSKIGGGGTIPTASNMLVNLANTTAGALAATNSYGSALSLGADADSGSLGVQQDVYIWLKVPASTAGGSYSTSYGVMSSVTP